MTDVFTEEFSREIERIDDALVAKFGGSVQDERRLLERTVKLSEEVGELSEAVLSYLGGQRDVKLEDFKKSHLDGEIADVIITALIIARSTDTDVSAAINDKLAKIAKRGGV